MTADYLTPPPEWEEPNSPDSDVDRRYLELSDALVDATRLDELPRNEPLIHEVLYLDSINWLHGKPGHGKSFIALDIACHISTGEPWRDHETHQHNVLYVVAEGAHGMRDRTEAWEIHNRRTIEPGRLIFLPVAVQLRKHLDTNALASVAKDHDARLIILDTQARVTVGADENSAKDMGEFIDNLEQLRAATGSAILIVHHESRAGDTLRGSTALEGAATTVIRAHKDGTLITLDNTKQKDGPEFQRLTGILKPIELSTGRQSVAWSHSTVELRRIATESEARLLNTARDICGTTGASSTTLLEASGLTKSTFHRALNALVSRGFIVNEGTGKRTHYVLTGTEPML